MNKLPLVLQVNHGLDSSKPILVPHVMQVNAKSIRREIHNGKEHFVIPSYTLPSNVIMNGGLYTNQEIDAHYAELEGTLAPVGHPTVNGKFISAFSAEGINANHVGAWNRNVRKEGNRVYAEKWVDIEMAKNSHNPDGPRLIERLEAMEAGEETDPIHTSVAAFLYREPAVNNQGYEWIARISSMDHDAILLDEPGAATPEQGVGLMVNVRDAKAVSLTANTGVLSDNSARNRDQRMESAARARFVAENDPDSYVWVADYDDSKAIVVRNGGVAELYDYSINEVGAIVFADTGTQVVRQESWINKIPVVGNVLAAIFSNHRARPDEPNEEGDMPLTKEEKAELVSEIGANVSGMFKEFAETVINPLAGQVKDLAANQKTMADSLTANARAEEETQRAAVKAHFKLSDEAVAGLAANALAEMFKQCGTAAPLNEGLDVNSGKDTGMGAPDPKGYFQEQQQA